LARNSVELGLMRDSMRSMQALLMPCGRDSARY
jgi:hypothetical protein